MARSPITTETRGLMSPRERMWAAIRKLGARGKRFTAEDVDFAAQPPVGRAALDTYIQSLVHAGVLLREGDPLTTRSAGARFAATGLVLARDVGVQAPRVGRKGQQLPAPANESMWVAMRTLKSFTYKDVALAASTTAAPVSLQTAKSYVSALERAGYFHTLKPGTPREAGLHRLIRYTGPKPPAITRAKVVFDRNLAELRLVSTAQEVCDAQD